MQQPLVNSPRHIEIRQITHTESALVLEGYSLLQETLGTESVENLGSFMETVSPLTDPAVVPKLVCALIGDNIAGITVGAYLRNLNMGFIVYSGVKDCFRRQGIYKRMRNDLLTLFNEEITRNAVFSRVRFQTCRVPYVISELDGDGWLYNKYVQDWGAYMLPCDYEQPEVQGLRGKPMKLVLQPIAGETLPGNHQLIGIVREVYERIYRISNAEENPAFRRAAASITS